MNQVEKADGYTVSIEGQGGDESLGGYLSHIHMALQDLHEDGGDGVLFDQLLAFTRETRESALEKARQFIATGFNAHTDLTSFSEASRPVEKVMGSWLRTVQLHDIVANKLPRTLRFNDRASAAWGREIRFPLLDYRVFAYGLAFGIRQKYEGGVSKAPLRNIIKKYLPGDYSTPKRSVVTPQTLWLKDELKDWALAHIAGLKARGLVDPRHFERVDRFFAERSSSNSFGVWQLINLNLMMERCAGYAHACPARAGVR
jgi:asparagine synthase (glutamine-hydrolysing)